MYGKSAIIVFILLILISFSVFSSTEKVLEVGPEGSEYLSLQEAIDMAKNGDTVLLNPGEYFVKDLVIVKSINLKGSDADKVIINIQGDNPLNILSISKKEFNLSDMTIKSDGLAIFARGYEKGEGNIHISNLKIYSKGCGIDLVGFGSSITNCEISARDSIITVRSASEYLTTSLASNITKIENCILKVNNEGLSTEEIAKTVGINFNGTGDAYLNNNEFAGISKTVITNGYWVLRNKY